MYDLIAVKFYRRLERLGLSEIEELPERLEGLDFPSDLRRSFRLDLELSDRLKVVVL